MVDRIIFGLFPYIVNDRDFDPFPDCSMDPVMDCGVCENS